MNNEIKKQSIKLYQHKTKWNLITDLCYIVPIIISLVLLIMNYKSFWYQESPLVSDNLLLNCTILCIISNLICIPIQILLKVGSTYSQKEYYIKTNNGKSRANLSDEISIYLAGILSSQIVIIIALILYTSFVSADTTKAFFNKQTILIVWACAIITNILFIYAENLEKDTILIRDPFKVRTKADVNKILTQDPKSPLRLWIKHLCLRTKTGTKLYYFMHKINLMYGSSIGLLMFFTLGTISAIILLIVSPVLAARSILYFAWIVIPIFVIVNISCLVLWTIITIIGSIVYALFIIAT